MSAFSAINCGWNVAGKSVVTIEGLGNRDQHPVLRAWIEHQVPQCGARHHAIFAGAEIAVAPTCPKPNSHGTVEMPTRDVTDRLGHGQHSQSEDEADPQKADTKCRKARGKHCATAAGKCQPESPRRIRH